MKTKNMKKMLISSILALAIVISITAGTYAWFVSEASWAHSIKMGTLLVEDHFEEINSGFYEPGITAKSAGYVQNNGNLDAILSFEFKTSVKLPTGNLGFTDVPDGLINHSFVPEDYMPTFDDDGNILSVWMYDTTTPSNLYLILAPGAKVDLTSEIVLTGNIGSEYMDARFNFDYKVKATQVMPGAVFDEFGVDIDNLDMYTGIVGFNLRAASNSNGEAARQVEALFAR